MTGAPIGEELGPVEGFAHRAEHEFADAMRRFTHPHLFHHDVPQPAATQAPASQPVNLAADAAAAPPKENPMSLATDVEQGWTAVENETAKFRQALPGLLEKAKAFEQSPFAQLAEKAAGAVLPPEAVAIAVKSADSVIDDLIALYATPAPAEPAAPAQ